MKVWELISQLSEMPAGAEVCVRLRWKEIDGDSIGYQVGVGDFVEKEDGCDGGWDAMLTLDTDLGEIIKCFKRCASPGPKADD